jgi:hypothetical protein
MPSGTLKTLYPLERNGRTTNQSRNRQQNVPLRTIIQRYLLTGSNGAGSPDKSSCDRAPCANGGIVDSCHR